MNPPCKMLPVGSRQHRTEGSESACVSLASDVLAHEALYSLVLKRQEILGRGTVCAHSRTAVGVILHEDL